MRLATLQTSEALAQRRLPVDEKTIARFWSKVDKSGPVPAHRPELGPCWVWRGKLNDAGYGIFTVGKRGYRSHRISWALLHGQPELHVLHKCDNPPCLNPEHLFAGTQQQNVADMWSKARGSKPPTQIGAANNRTKLTPEQVIEIRKLYADGVSQPEIGERFGLGQAKVSDVVLCKVWRHLPGATPQKRQLSDRLNVKLTDSDVRRMRELHASGLSTTAIAKQFGMCANATRNAITGKTWAHVR